MLKISSISRLKLRPVNSHDADELYTKAYNNDEFMQLFKLNSIRDKQQIKKVLLDREKVSFNERSYKEYVIEHPQYGPIGLAALADHNTFHNSAEILIGLFDEQYRNSLYGLQASLLLLDIAFNQFGLNRLNSYVYGHNQYACQCTLKLGFEPEGLRKDYIYIEETQTYIDVSCFGLRRVDFRASKKLARLSLRLFDKDITRSNKIKTTAKRKASILAASAICSKLALAPAYGKTSSSGNGQTTSGGIDVSHGTDTSSAVPPSEGKTAAGVGSQNFSRINCPENATESDEPFDPLASVLFLDSFYVKANPDLKDILGSDFTYTDARQHWVDYGLVEGRVASPSFDVKYYLDQNLDLKQIFRTDYVAAAEHWIKTGIHEGRLGASAFNAQYYLSANADIYKYFGADFSQATAHWLKTGIVEGRKFSENLDVKYYLNNNADLKNVFANNYAAAVTHWLLRGKNEDRVYIKEEDNLENKVSCTQLGSIAHSYHPGDYIKYTATYEITTSKSNTTYVVNGSAMTKYATANVSNPDASQTLKLNMDTTYWGQTNTDVSYIFFDGVGNLKTYQTSNKECVNQTVCEEGYMLWPIQIAIGDDWSNQYTVEEQGELIEFKSSSQVIDKENVETPVGNFDAYKIEYSHIKQNACTTFDCSSNVSESYTKTGTIWYVPGLGEVKRDEQYFIVKPDGNRTIKTSSIISASNI